jgi:23S rRNA m(5)U-1939 methyltransferase (EC 2.1.1.-)
MLNKNQVPEIIEHLHITAMSSDGRGIGKTQSGKVIFVAMGVPGDVADVEVFRENKKYAEGKLHCLHKVSPTRTAPCCTHFGVCGGCKWQHIRYAEQLKFKKQIVLDAFTRIAKVQIPPLPDVLGSENNYYYRNKLEFAFTEKRWLTEEEVAANIQFEHRNGVGFHVPGNFLGVLDIERCHLQVEPSNAIRLAAKQFALQNGYSFFNFKKQHGLLRNLMVRTASTGQVLVLFSFFENDESKINALLQYIAETFPAITSLQYVINPKRNDTIYDLMPQVFKGEAYIIEQLGKYQFKIGPKSFFQTNTTQAKLLYDLVVEFAELKPTDVVYDLYTGVGSIAIYLSHLCKSVTGIEYIDEAIADARENALLNDVTNCTFHAGDVRMTLQPDFVHKHGKPDVVITDPPRSGMHRDVVNYLLQLEAPRIVYVSCNVATQARDIELLTEKYTVIRIQPMGIL